MKMFLLIAAGVIYGIVALLMLGAVLLQESKGGGLAALGGTRAESAFGASNPLRRLTVGLSIIFFLLASVLSLALAPEDSVTKKGGKEDKPPTAGAAEEDDKDEEDKDGKGKNGVVEETDIKPGEKKPDVKEPGPEAPEKDGAKGEGEPGEKAPAEKPPAD